MEIAYVLSAEGAEEIAAEMKNAPADTPERRATFARARAARKLVDEVIAAKQPGRR